MRYCTTLNGEHHLSIPDDKKLREGTLNTILAMVCRHHNLEKEELLDILFGK